MIFVVLWMWNLTVKLAIWSWVITWHGTLLCWRFLRWALRPLTKKDATDDH